MKFFLGISLFIFPYLSISCNSNVQNTQILKVYDGDTVFFKNGKKGRLFGIDTPELKKGRHKTKGIERTIALLSKKCLQDLLKNKKITFEVITQDKYGRDVIKLFAENIDVGKILVAKGYARVAYITNETKSIYFSEDEFYLNDLLWLQYKAYKNNKVIWKNKKVFKKIFPKSK